jgi:hypothetical protein
MAAFSLPDLIHQCRLARWEEEYSIMDTLELPPGQRISYPLLLCAGQELKFKICASRPLAASIGFEAREPLDDLPEPFIHNPEASCFVIDHDVKRTAYHLLAIVNTSAEPVDVTIEINAKLREPTARTRFEVAVALFSYFLRKSEHLCRVLATSPEEVPNAERDDGAEP